jgi:hypothetical protein
MNIDMTINIDPAELARQLKREKDGGDFTECFIASLDSDLYRKVAQFIKDNPDESIECPRCKRHTNKQRESTLGIMMNFCEHCRVVLP